MPPGHLPPATLAPRRHLPPGTYLRNPLFDFKNFWLSFRYIPKDKPCKKFLKSNKGFRRYVPGGKCRRGASVAGGKCLGGKCRAVLQSAPECSRVFQNAPKCSKVLPHWSECHLSFKLGGGAKKTKMRTLQIFCVYCTNIPHTYTAEESKKSQMKN